MASADCDWKDLDIPRADEFAQGFASLGWVKPLEVQVQTLPLIFKSPYRNVIAQAPTGKGKTGAFAVGMLGRCDAGVSQPQAICIAPTREIANQTADNTVSVLAGFLGLTVFKAVRDAESAETIKDHVVVGTPGTVIKLIKSGKLAVDQVRVLVIDEADTMVQKDIEKKADMSGKKPKDMTRTVLDIKTAIDNASGGNLQCLLFSATFDDKALNYARRIAPDGEEFLTQSQDDQHPVDNVQQYVFHCSQLKDKFAVLQRFLRQMTIGSCIIFTNVRSSWIICVSEGVSLFVSSSVH
eukprot:TRINITY_DN1780_c0_g2_i2.p2 TRINITY_DN1780_c0_g2~~TRINITY_DN1780_c0_g2_i2.p2  ORF type:complete len:296 (-),score=84.12 TRINITY_DN1780_c0_g2_i2:1559-2446(-)